MKIHQIECSNCGASLNIEDGRVKGFCQYCGAEYIIQADEKTEKENKSQDVVMKFEKAISAERAGNYPQAITLYKELLVQAPEIKDHVLIGLAFATITESKENLHNLDKFKTLFTDAVKNATINKIVLHILVLDKLWSIKKFIMANLLKLENQDPQYAEDLIALNDLQMYINDFIDEVDLHNVPQTYIANYKDLKEGIKFFGGQILARAKKDKGFASRRYLRYVKANVKSAEKELVILNKKYY